MLPSSWLPLHRHTGDPTIITQEASPPQRLSEGQVQTDRKRHQMFVVGELAGQK